MNMYAVAVNMEEQGLPSGASQGSLDPPFHKHLPAVLTDDYPPLPDAHPPSSTDAHSPVPNVHPPLPDVHHEPTPILAEPISCSPSYNPGKHMLSHQCCVCSEGTRG